MKLKLNKPLAVFDLETTGTSIALDRIVEISVVKMLPDGSEEVHTQTLHPTVPIPLEASLIHGIYDKHVKDQPTFKDFAHRLVALLKGCDLGGFNCLKFDIPLLLEEFVRVGVSFDLSNRMFVDAQKIFHLMEKRTLSAAYQFYCHQTLESAHSAEADALATAKVIRAQVEKYAGQEATNTQGKKIGLLANDVQSLHQVSTPDMVDLAGRFVINNEGIVVFNFGKHRLKPVADILKTEPRYYDWMMQADFSQETKQKLTQIKLKAFAGQ